MPSHVAVSGAAVDYRALAGISGQRMGFLDSRGLTGELTRAELFDDARAAAAGLAHHGLSAGDAVVLVMPTGSDHLTVLLGCLMSGIVPCTVAPPVSPEKPASAGVRHLHAAVDVVAPRAVIAADHHVTAGLPAGVPVLTPGDLRGQGTLSVDRLPEPDPDALHHIQLTSGSTSAPKAVALTHRNVAANLAVLAAATEAHPTADRISTWLPLYHDMGLVTVLLALTTGAGLDLMPPIGFLRDPLAWLRHIADRGATLTAAPPFAYRTTADRHRKRPAEHLDLSRLRQMYVGAEPIPAAVLRDFRDTFSPIGLVDDVLVPCYGMAETVLATTLALDDRPGDGRLFGRVRVRDFDRALLDEKLLAAPAIPGQPSRRIVSCGPPVDRTTLRLTDADGRTVPPGRIGTIKVRGSSVMAGYRSASGVEAPPGGWHDTGDLGLLWLDDLYVVGRTKEMLIVRGRNLPPYDVEAVIEEHPAVGPGNAAVFSHPAEEKGTEPIVAVVETRVPSPEWAQVRADVAVAVRQVFGLSLAEVVVVTRGSIPRTSSGKRRRAALRNTYLAGGLS